MGVPYGNSKISGVTRVEGNPTEGIPVDILHRSSGKIIDTVVSGFGGQFVFNGLNKDEVYDVISRVPGKNAVISDTRRPVDGDNVDPYLDNVVFLANCYEDAGLVDIGYPLSNYDSAGQLGMTFHGAGPFPGTSAVGNSRPIDTQACVRAYVPGAEVGLQPITIELMVKPFNQGYTFNGFGGSYPRIFQLGQWGFTGKEGVAMYAQLNNLDGIIRTQLFNGSTYRDIAPGNAGKLIPDKWNHVAWVRDGTTYRVFINGEKRFEAVHTTPLNINPTGFFGIGGNARTDSSADREAFNGMFSAIRITAGIARYTQDFVPPNKPYPNKGRIYANIDRMRSFAPYALSASWDARKNSTSYSSYLVFGDMPKTKGKWYFEMKRLGAAGTSRIGLCERYGAINWTVGRNIWCYGSEGRQFYAARAGGSSQYPDVLPTYTTNDWIGVAVDLDEGVIRYYKNGVLVGSPTDKIPAGLVVVPQFFDGAGSAVAYEANFGQDPFPYGVPEGYNPGWYVDTN